MLLIICTRLPGTRGFRYFRKKLVFTSICPLLITFTTNLYLHRETWISYKIYAGCHQKGDFLEKIFCLCVENVMHVLEPFYFVSSHGVGRLFTYKALVVKSGQTGFALIIALKC